jgi:uncharacterized protein YecE (DUF72 family)
MQMLAGTSGYSYKEWVGAFYPEKTPAAAMLRYYAGRFPTVEINNTFYRMPAEGLLEAWAAEVPETFRFTLKAPRRLTHIKRLKEVTADVAEFVRRASILKERLGMLLFQLPPTLRKDLPRLREFLAGLPPAVRIAMEFRHDSWHDDEVYDALRERSAAVCIAEDDEGAWPFVCTSQDAYLRLRRTQYGEEDLRAWADRLKAQPLERAWVYFKHEDEALAPQFAVRFTEVWSASQGPPAAERPAAKRPAPKEGRR